MTQTGNRITDHPPRTRETATATDLENKIALKIRTNNSVEECIDSGYTRTAIGGRALTDAQKTQIIRALSAWPVPWTTDFPSTRRHESLIKEGEPAATQIPWSAEKAATSAIIGQGDHGQTNKSE